MTTETKLYPEQDHPTLGDWYIRHVQAMTAEGLHAKSDIAAQLAWRDEELTRLRAVNAELLAALQETWRVIDSAGLNNLVNGVQLGPTVWYVKASDAKALSAAAIKNATA